jgi:hypothetical protein
LSLSPSRLEEPTGNLKLFLGGQPVKNPESNAQGQATPALVIHVKAVQFRPPVPRSDSYEAAQGDSLRRPAVAFTLAQPLTGLWALQGAGSRKNHEIIPDEVVAQWNGTFESVVSCNGERLSQLIQHEDPLWTGWQFPCSGGGYFKGNVAYLACANAEAARALKEVYEEGVAQMVATSSGTTSFLSASPWEDGQGPPEWAQTKISVVYVHLDPHTYTVRSTEDVVRDPRRAIWVRLGLVPPMDLRGVSGTEKRLLAQCLLHIWDKEAITAEITCIMCDISTGVGVPVNQRMEYLCPGCFGLVISGADSLPVPPRTADVNLQTPTGFLTWSRQCEQGDCASVNSVSVAGPGQAAKCGLCASKEAQLVGEKEWFAKLGYQNRAEAADDPLVMMLVRMVLPEVASQFGRWAVSEGDSPRWVISKKDERADESDKGIPADACLLCGIFTVSPADSKRGYCGSCRINEDLCLYCPAAAGDRGLTCSSCKKPGRKKCRFCLGTLAQGDQTVCKDCFVCGKVNGCVGRQVREKGQFCKEGCRFMLDMHDEDEQGGDDTFYRGGRCVQIGGTVRKCRTCVKEFLFEDAGFYTDVWGFTYCDECQGNNNTIPCAQCNSCTEGHFDSSSDAFYCQPCHAEYNRALDDDGGDDTAAGEAGACSADERMADTDGAGDSREEIDADGALITSEEPGDTDHVTGAAAGEPNTGEKTGDKDYIGRAELADTGGQSGSMAADTGGQSGNMTGRKGKGERHQAPELQLSARSSARAAETEVDGETGARQAEAAASGDGAPRGGEAGATSAGRETAGDVDMEDVSGVSGGVSSGNASQGFR